MLPPDINESQLRFTVEPGKGVRFGLTAIKNVGEGAIESLLDVRAKQGRITSLHALCEDLDLRLVNKRVFESLVKAGAFDSFAAAGAAALPSTALRPRLMAAIDAAASTARGSSAIANEGQGAAVRRVEDATHRRSTAAAGHGCRCRRPGRGPNRAARRSRRKRSACTGAAIRSIAIAAS